MSSSDYRRQAPPAVMTTEGPDEDYDYSAALRRKSYEQSYKNQTAARRTPPKPENPARASRGNVMEDPLLDLEQLEELHEEAERMKALGNKHMASQEFTRAYNAYSAALQLSPVGPSSHVFLCNRAAALLSLKRYAAASIDARRAIALAPTFGKAHARLGQSLYFLKDYEGAVAAYEEALRFEPDNGVTQTYLNKAKSKLARQHEKARRVARGDEVSVTEDSIAQTVVNSIATDPSRRAAVVTSGNRGNQTVLKAAAARHAMPIQINSGFLSEEPSPLAEGAPDGEFEDDPDFDQAVLIQEHANKLLAAKRYKEAIENYSAALFLVPDDPYLSPELHLGRAHALNGSHRHESAKNDALLAIKINPSSEAYSTLAKSLFYMKDYLGAVAAFEDCMDLLPQGESLSMFDQAYLRKAEAAWQDELENNPNDARSMTSSKASSTIPKLPPPRFVPREKAVNSSPSIPAMPRQWPQQSMTSPTALKVGPERNVTFLSESLGIKLNRGSDGIVRVLSVSPETPGSEIARSGTIEAGDIVREAAGVDIRRPITNIMWGDTIALVKIAPRPITMIVAKELSEIPQSVLEERERAAQEDSLSPAARSIRRGESKEEEEYILQPSPAVGEESVRNSIAMKNEKAAQASPSADVSESSVDTSSSQVESSSTNVNTDSLDHSQKEEEATGNITIEPPELAASSESVSCREDDMETYVMDVKKTALDVNITELLAVNEVKTVDTNVCEKEVIEGTDREAAANKQRGVVEGNKGQDEALAGPYTESSAEGDESFVLVESKQQIFSRDEEVKAIGAEILFGKRDDGLGVDDWTNLRWMSTSGERQLRFCKVVTRTKESRKGLFRSGEQYARRKLAIYENPNLILLLRSPTSKSEVRNLLDLPDGVALDDEKNVLKSFLVAESVIDPLTCMLRLSQLTTITSVGSNVSDEKESQRRPSCLELVTPTETISLSALSPEQERALSKKQALPGGPAFLQTASLENAIANALYHAHGSHAEPDGIADVAWKHQVVQGTLHSFVISGNNAMLERAIKAAVSVDPSSGESTMHVPSRVIDAQDESGRTALHYACLRRASHAVSLLTQAGASCSIPIHPGGFFPVHLSALVHDDKSLSVILSATHPCRPDPNELDALNRTPAYLAAVEGKLPLGMEHDTDSLGRCLSALEAWGGQLLPNNSLIALRNPVSILASRWAYQEVAAVILHNQFRYPAASFEGMSVGASFQYPIHSALITLRKRIQMIRENIENEYLLTDDNDSPESALVGTIRVLLEHGLEANERLEGVTEYFEGASDLIEYTGYAPIQILAAAALDAGSLKDVATTELMQSIAQMVAGSVELLVRCGARITLHLPPAIRPRRTASSCIPKGSNINTWAEEKDRESLKIDSNTLVLLLGDEARLERAKDQWSEIKSVEAPGRTAMSIQIQVSKGSIEDSPAPGGSDELSCAICWKEFGAIMNRRQKCSISMRYVCDECSGKRIVVGKQEYRVSDGQFYLARVDATRQVTDAAAHQKARAAIRAEEVRAARETPSEDDNRESLFGSMLDKAATLVLGEEDAADLTGRQVDGLSSQMNQTRDALNERGEKLNSLGEKTSALADSSAQFAKMAKELERSQKGGLFW